MQVTPKIIKRVAYLSRIMLTDEESEEMQKHFTAMSEYTDVLGSVQLDGVQSTEHILDKVNALRTDEIKPFDGKSLLSSAPERDEDYYIVPRVVE